jgi:hypothetical protein
MNARAERSNLNATGGRLLRSARNEILKFIVWDALSVFLQKSLEGEQQ